MALTAKCPACKHSLSGYHITYDEGVHPWNGTPNSKKLWCGWCKHHGESEWCIIDGVVQVKEKKKK